MDIPVIISITARYVHSKNLGASSCTSIQKCAEMVSHVNIKKKFQVEKIWNDATKINMEGNDISDNSVNFGTPVKNFFKVITVCWLFCQTNKTQVTYNFLPDRPQPFQPPTGAYLP